MKEFSNKISMLNHIFLYAIITFIQNYILHICMSYFVLFIYKFLLTKVEV